MTGAREGADDDAVEQGLGSEEQAALEGAGGDLHQGAAGGDEAEKSGHGVALGEQGPGQVEVSTVSSRYERSWYPLWTNLRRGCCQAIWRERSRGRPQKPTGYRFANMSKDLVTSAIFALGAIQRRVMASVLPRLGWHFFWVPNSLNPHLCPERTWYNSSQLGASATLRTPTWHLRMAEASSHSVVLGVELSSRCRGDAAYTVHIATYRWCGQPGASTGRIPRCRAAPLVRPISVGVCRR